MNVTCSLTVSGASLAGASWEFMARCTTAVTVSLTFWINKKVITLKKYNYQGHWIRQFGCVFYHCYTDKTILVYRSGDLSTLSALYKCLAEISSRMSLNSPFIKSHRLCGFSFFPQTTSLLTILQTPPRSATNRTLFVKTVIQAFYFPLEYIAKIFPLLSFK